MESAAAIKVSEDSYAEQPTLEWLIENGWDYVYGPDIAPSGSAPERTHWSDVVLTGRLESAIRRINPKLPADAVRRAVELVLTTTSTEVILDHRDFHDFLLRGVPVTYLDDDGVERSPRAKVVDFDDLDNNDFVTVNQFRIVVGGKNRRPDVLLFVNGLPLGQIELKNPTAEPEGDLGDSELEDASAVAAVNQVAHYRDTIPKLYRYVEVIGVSDLLQARVGTITTPPEHFAEWKSMDEDENNALSPLELMVRGAFATEPFLDLIRDYVFFETSGAKTWKIIAKYHQYDAVKRALQATVDAMDDDRRAGVVWHTQGSGKSYTMSFYVTKLRRDPRFANPTVVALTDRNALDDQLYKQFLRLPHLADAVSRAERIQGGADSLYDRLQVPTGGIVFTTIQKFQPPAEARKERVAGQRVPMPVLSERRNVIVMCDEAHRSEYGDLARNVAQALPNAVRIGFTGTPIEIGDKSTRATFGDFISIYRMKRAQDDKAIVPIFYDSRQIAVQIADPTELLKVEEVLEDEELEAANKLVTPWAKLETVVGADARLDKVADDIAEHFTKRCERLPGKAMVVGYSRRIAAELTERLQQRLGKDAVTCVITAQATEDPKLSQFRRSKTETRALEDEFKEPDSPTRMVVVRDMWLTGFDVPSLHTLYVDKPMRDHGLLQAIARVNRVFADKPGGLVVDYIGIGDDLRESLTAYSKGDVDDVAVPFSTAVKKLRERHEVMLGLLHGIDFHPTEGMSAGQRATLFTKAVRDAADRFLADDEQTQLYLDEQLQFARWYALVSPDTAALGLAYDEGFFTTVAKQIRAVAPKKGEASKEAEQAVKQFFAEGLAAGDVVDVFELAGTERPEISVLSDEFLEHVKDIDQPNLRVALMQKLLKGEIRARLRNNALQAKQFSDEVEAVLGRYRNKQLTSGEVVEALVELAKRLRDAKKRNEELGLSDEEAAFYDALAGHSEDWNADPQLAAIAHDLVKAIKADLTYDWADRSNAEAAIRAKVKRLLRTRGYTPPKPPGNGSGCGGDVTVDHVTQLVMAQAKSLYRYWPEVGVDGHLFVDRQFA
jgi:type I restriction enzyme R subunit